MIAPKDPPPGPPALLRLEGTSVAGVETCVELPDQRLAFDLGRCRTSTERCDTVLVSHGHLDHAGALPQHAARRALKGMTVPTYVVPRAIAPRVEALFEAAAALREAPIPRAVLPLDPGEELRLGAHLTVRPFETFHRVAAQGYALWARRLVLRPELRALPPAEIGRLRARGVVVADSIDVPEVAFSGDTRIEVLEREEVVRRARLLVLEVTYLDGRVSVAEARARGHVHLDEVIERAALFENEAIAFCHFSARYRPPEIERILAERLPEALARRARALVGRPRTAHGG